VRPFFARTTGMAPAFFQRRGDGHHVISVHVVGYQMATFRVLTPRMAFRSMLRAADTRPRTTCGSSELHSIASITKCESGREIA
jgi:hypothetical protein